MELWHGASCFHKGMKKLSLPAATCRRDGCEEFSIELSSSMHIKVHKDHNNVSEEAWQKHPCEVYVCIDGCMHDRWVDRQASFRNHHVLKNFPSIHNELKNCFNNNKEQNYIKIKINLLC